MNKIKSLLILAVLSSTFLAAFMPFQYTSAAGSCTNAKFLTAPAWYRGVVKDNGGSCDVTVDVVGGDIKKFIWTIAFNIVEIMLNIVAYVSVAFIIVGGFKYITSAGSQQGNVSGRKTIINAVIGLIISIMSIGLVNFVLRGIVS